MKKKKKPLWKLVLESFLDFIKTIFWSIVIGYILMKITFKKAGILDQEVKE